MHKQLYLLRIKKQAWGNLLDAISVYLVNNV